jgi:hypothetical protein
VHDVCCAILTGDKSICPDCADTVKKETANNKQRPVSCHSNNLSKQNMSPNCKNSKVHSNHDKMASNGVVKANDVQLPPKTTKVHGGDGCLTLCCAGTRCATMDADDNLVNCHKCSLFVHDVCCAILPDGIFCPECADTKKIETIAIPTNDAEVNTVSSVNRSKTQNQLTPLKVEKLSNVAKKFKIGPKRLKQYAGHLKIRNILLALMNQQYMLSPI